MPAAEGWRLFQLGQRRYARLPSTPEAWPSGIPVASTWRTLAAPTGAYRPVQVLAGQRGYFHVVDAASARLCLYDAEGSLLSTFPLPAEFTPFPAGRAAVFRGADDAYTFIDYGAGEAWQFAERQTLDAGATRWTARGRVKLPGGTRDCAQPPGSSELFCRDAAGGPLRFDGALNRISIRNPGGDVAMERVGAESHTMRATWSAAESPNDSVTPDTSAADFAMGAQWTFIAYSSRSMNDSVLFIYRPLEKSWAPVPPTSVSNPVP